MLQLKKKKRHRTLKFSKGISKELQLLLILTRKESVENKNEWFIRRNILNLVDENFNWEHFISLAKKHRVIPLLNKALSNKSEYIPAWVLNVIRGICNQITIHMLLIAAEHGRLQELLEKSQIKFVLLKGIALSTAIYGDITLRQIRDIDLLFNESDIATVENILKDVGYIPVIEKDDEYECGESYKKDPLSSHHIVFYHPQTKVTVELHWRILKQQFMIPYEKSLNKPNHIFTFNSIYSCGKKFLFGGRKISVMSEEDEILYLIYHGAEHSYFRIKWLIDIFEKMKDTTQIERMCIIHKAYQLGMIHLIAQALLLCHYLLDLPLGEFDDEKLKKAFRSQSVKILVQLAMDRIIADEDFPSNTSESIKDRVIKVIVYWLVRFTALVGIWSRIKLLGALIHYFLIQKSVGRIKKFLID